MEDNRKKRVLDAAIEIFAKQGYSQAAIYEISKKARVASGLVYSPHFFKNKLDLLLSIVLFFWQRLNNGIEEEISRLKEPKDKLNRILEITQRSLTENKRSIYLAKVVHDSLPYIYTIKEKELKQKRRKITDENRKLLNTLDGIIEEGQKKGKFDNSLSASAMRQVLYGAFEMLMYGIFLKISGREKEIGYGEEEIPKVMNKLISSFLGQSFSE